MRFELTDPFGSSVFKTGAINRTLPRFDNWRTPKDSNPDKQGWSLLCCHYTRDTLFGTIDGNRTRHDLIDSQVSPPGGLYGIKIGGVSWDRTRRARGGGFTVHCITIDASTPCSSCRRDLHPQYTRYVKSSLPNDTCFLHTNDDTFWHRVRESNPSLQFEGLRISPEIQRDIIWFLRQESNL